MIRYLMILTLVALLGLFIDENRMSTLLKLALFYFGWMILLGWWLDWPEQHSKGILFVSVISFIFTKTYLRLLSKRGFSTQAYDALMGLYYGMNLSVLTATMLNP